MARPKLPEKFRLSVQARVCLTKSEYAALGRHTRVKGRTISTFLRELVLAELAAAQPPATQ